MTNSPDAPASRRSLGHRRRRRRHLGLRGLAAVAAGAVLLLGGGTSFAYWSATVTTGSATLSTGDLDLGVGAPTWRLNGTVITNAASVRLVPGDVLELTQTVTPRLVGDTIKATLTADTTALPAAPLTVAVRYDGALLPSQGIELTAATATGTAKTAVVTLTFPASVTGRTSVNTAVSLSAVQFVLTQHA